MHLRASRLLAAILVATLAVTVATAGLAAAGGRKAKKSETLTAAEIEARVLEGTREFVGTVEGTDAYISITEFEGDVEVYICDGAELIAWPRGTVKRDGSLEAKSAAGLTVTGRLDDRGVTGTVTLADGTEHAFSAEPAVHPAGLYRRAPSVDADGESVRAATIVLADGTQRGGTSSASVETCTSIAKEALNYISQLTVESDGSGGFGVTGPIGAADKAESLTRLFFSSGCLKTVGTALISPAR